MNGLISRGYSDKPLSFHWRAQDNGWLQRFDLPPPRSQSYAQARASILLEAYLVGCEEPGRAISYSRRKAFYAGQQRYHGTPYTYRHVVGAVDELAQLGLINSIKATPGQLGWQSRFHATGKLVTAINEPLTVVFDPREIIRLKDEDGRLTGYRDTERSHRMRKHVAEINEALTATRIDLTAPGTIHHGNTIRCGEHVLNTSMQCLWRVFNRGTFTLGGRFYGGWWQSARKADRAHLTIDNEPTVELDYPGLHPSLLYAEKGLTLQGDPYDIDGWKRKLVKLALLIMINARTDQQAQAAIAEQIGGKGCFKQAASLMQAIKHKHTVIADAFCSDAGLRLQRRDADMAEDVMLSLLKKGIVALPVHDSFIACERHKQPLMEAMAAALGRCVFAGDKPVKSSGYFNTVPHMEVGGAPVLVVLPRSWGQPDLFGGVSCSLPFDVIAGWSSGIIPACVHDAVLHELKRRDLRQEDLADIIGISRPTLANILHRRFGASRQVARRLRDFILEGAETVGLMSA